MVSQYANDFNRATQTYYEELKRYKPMTKAKERRLLKKCKKGSLKAKNEILEANLRFVFDIAKHYTGRGVPISDLISDGNIGLLRAIDKFDESKDIKFISYAVWWIKQAMLESIKRKNSITFVDIEPNTDNDSCVDSKLIDDEEDDLISLSEMAYSNESEEHKREVRQFQKDIISKLLESLNEKERGIIESYYGINDKKELTLSDIGKEINLSTERVRQIKRKCLNKMRSEVLLLGDLENLFT